MLGSKQVAKQTCTGENNIKLETTRLNQWVQDPGSRLDGFFRDEQKSLHF